jgi:L-alanine-DL-glutamate epimerase-like enolase superfamily enzyme
MSRDSLEIGAIWPQLWKYKRFVPLHAIGAIDVALWDIAGKAVGMAIHRLLNVANLHVNIAVPKCVSFEVLLPDGANQFALVRDIEVSREGHVQAPEKSGLGYEINWDPVKCHTTQVLR